MHRWALARALRGLDLVSAEARGSGLRTGQAGAKRMNWIVKFEWVLIED